MDKTGEGKRLAMSDYADKIAAEAFPSKPGFCASTTDMRHRAKCAAAIRAAEPEIRADERRIMADCPHPMLNGVSTYNGPDKLWLCSICGGFFGEGLAPATAKDAFAEIRRQALEDACKAVCGCCRAESPVVWRNDAPTHDWVDAIGQDYCVCKASAIRSMIDAPPTEPQK